MVSNVGKWFYHAIAICCFAFVVSSNLCAYVELSVKSLDQKILKQAGVGRPFFVELAIAGHDSSSDPLIDGLDQCQVLGVTKQFNMINGKTTVRYHYQVRIDQPGTFTLGPAHVEIAGSDKQSNSVSVVVAADQQADRGVEQNDGALLKLSCNKSHVVVGEKIECTISFYGIVDKAHLEQLIEPKIEGNIGAKRGPETKTTMIDGKEYQVIELQFDLFPTKVGRLIVPAFGAEVSIQHHMQNQLTSFFPFAQFLNQVTRIYSNGCVIEVEPLPANQGIQGVGYFSNFVATIKPSEARAGEGMVLTLQLEGDGNVADIETPQLHDMPAVFKWYESKRQVSDKMGPHNLPLINFEYIVQGLEQGSWEIPPQTFTYYDVQTKKVRTLTTSAQWVTIKPGSIVQSFSPQSAATALQQKENGAPEAPQWSILHTGRWQAPARGFVIPWYLFFIAMVVPLIWVLGIVLQKYSLLYLPYAMYKRAFSNAHKQVRAAAGKQEVVALLPIFNELFAIRLHVPVSSVTTQMIDEYLHTKGMRTEKIRSWNDYIHALEEESFGKKTRGHSPAILFEQAHLWITELEGLL